MITNEEILDSDLDMKPVREQNINYQRHQNSVADERSANYTGLYQDIPKKAHRKSVNYEVDNEELERKSAFLQEMKYGIPPTKGNKKRQ